MNVYTVILAFDAPQLGLEIALGNTVGKVASRTSAVINSTEYSNEAFWQWIGTADSLRFLAFSGVLPDPPIPGSVNIKSGSFNIPAGASEVDVVQAFGFIPTAVVATVGMPDGGDNFFPTVLASSITAAGFTATLSAPTSGAGYVLYYVAME